MNSCVYLSIALVSSNLVLDVLASCLLLKRRLWEWRFEGALFVFHRLAQTGLVTTLLLAVSRNWAQSIVIPRLSIFIEGSVQVSSTREFPVMLRTHSYQCIHS